MIDYEGLHKQIKAQLKPDSPMPKGYALETFLVGYGFQAVPDGYSLFSSSIKPFGFYEEFYQNSMYELEWFANALQIPLEDNGYTDLVKAAELQLSITREWHEVKTDDEVEAWSNSANDGEISLRAALERIKSENQ